MGSENINDSVLDGDKDQHGQGTDRDKLISHLREVRTRVVYSVVAILIAFGFSYPFSEYFFEILTGPLLPALPEGNSLAYTGIVEPFFTYLKVAFCASFIFASPVVLYQFWAFIAPALYDKEKKVFVIIVIFSALLFYSGSYFAYGFIFPVGFDYLIKFAGTDVVPVITMGGYFSLATKLLIAFGLIFQIPLVILVLSLLGVVTAKMLLGWWRYALLGSVIISALLTPPDVISQVLMAVPMMGLYFAGIVIAYFFGKKKDVGENPDDKTE